MRNLPQPDTFARDHSDQLSKIIAEKIQGSCGQIPFSEFMQMALYTKNFGYYVSGKIKFGPKGDFVTAPELSPLFGQCIANCIKPFSNILELGAGSGKLAANLLNHCPQLSEYLILEISPDLKELQQKTIQELAPDHFHKVEWLDRLTEISGIIIANEVMDALPATRFCWKNNTVYEYFVRVENQTFQWHLDTPSDSSITTFVQSLDLPDHYSSEIHLLLNPWIRSLSDNLKEGFILLFDYGFPCHEFYHPDRSMGTLMCHYQHHSHHDPFWYPGLSDITTHVNFTSVAKAAVESNLSVSGYTSQAAFLLECGILEMTTDINSKNQIKTLTLPNEMGELFKVMALSKNISENIKGFNLQDRRDRL